MVKSIVGEDGSRAIDIPAGDVAPGIITTTIGLPRLVATGRAQAVEPGQLVRAGAALLQVLKGDEHTGVEDGLAVETWKSK